jgi:hypothetical protein
MPISLDFPEITDAFRKFLLLPVRQIAHSFEALSAWLTKRIKTADLLERGSRDYPLLRFEGDAVALWLDPIQARALAPDDKVPSLGDHVRAAGRHFLEGIEGSGMQVTQDLILPTTLGTIADAIEAIGASVDRFAQPPAQMEDLLFGHSGVGGNDPRHRTAGDLWGEAALASRSVWSSVGQITLFKAHIVAAKAKLSAPAAGSAKLETAEVDIVSGASPIVGAAGANIAAVAPATDGSMVDKINRFGRYMLAGVLLIPTLPLFAQSLWAALTIRVKTTLIEAFAGFEARINSYRKLVITFMFAGFRKILRQALAYILASQLALTVNIKFYSKIALQYGQLVVVALRLWFIGIADTLNKYIGYVNKALDVINSILNFDVSAVIADLLRVAFGRAAEPVIALLPRITIDDLITAGTDLARRGLRVALTAFSAGLKALVWLLPVPDSVERRVSALPSLFWNMFRPPRKYPEKGGGLTWPAGYGFPNLYDKIFSPGLPDLRRAVGGLANTVPQSVNDILGVGSVALRIWADEFESQADAATGVASTARFRGLAATAARQAQAVFGPDVTALTDRVTAYEAHPDPVAAQIEDWFAFGGFQLLTDAIPAYFLEMRAFWRDRQAHDEEPSVLIDKTSPHILAKHAKLSRTKVKQVVVKAAGKPVDRSLVDEVAVYFRAAVQQAHFTGEAQLQHFALPSAR